MRVLRWISFLTLICLLATLFVNPALAQDKRLYWENYDVDIAIQQDGCFRVVESQELTFTVGTFRYGIRSIPNDYTGSMTEFRVSEADGPAYTISGSGEPYTYEVYQVDNTVNVRYNFPPSSDSSRTIIISYLVCGGLLYYDGGDQLVWKAVPSNSNFPIQNASVTVHLPEGATLDNYDATGPRGTASVLANINAVRFVTDEPIRAGSNDFAVRVQWPHGLVAGQASEWQQSMDRTDQIKPLANLGVLALSALALIGGLLGLYLLWYHKGRDLPVKLPADWIPEPPSDLPAGMVGTLIDEHADTKDVIATLVDLARRGVLAIEEETKPGAFGIGSKQDFIYHLENDKLPMRSYEQLLITKLFGKEKSKRLSDLRNKFFTVMKSLQEGLYTSVVDEAYFPRNPERVRSSYGILGIALLTGAGLVGCFGMAALAQWSDLALCLPAAFAVPALGMIVLARYMPRKSDKGAEEAAKWLAFKRYMENIEQYTQVDEVKQIFDRYLPYAIAFGIEKSWIARFSQVDTPAPPWYYPGPYMGPRPRGWGWWGSGPMTSGPSMGPVSSGESKPSLPGMSDVSRGMGAGLTGMSAGLAGMLTSASSVLTSQPAGQSGSGSWSRGGGSWSGGGGFSGGGGGGSSFG